MAALLTHITLLLGTAVFGRCAVTAYVENVSPASGTVIAETLGPTNRAFACDVFEMHGEDVQVSTRWYLRLPPATNPTGLLVVDIDPSGEFVVSGTARNGSLLFPTFTNFFNIINMTSRLDEATLICGHSQSGFRELASWQLRILYPPLLRDGLIVRVDERDGLISVDLALPPLAFPIPSLPQWTKDGSLVNSDLRVVYNYSKVLFHSLQRSDSGLYSLSATNHRSNGSVIGSDTGSFTLEVLYGPELVLNHLPVAVLVGSPVTLSCGHSLASNPPPTVVWTQPNGEPLSNGGRYTLSMGSEVSLSVNTTVGSDSGVWRCDLTTSDPDIVTAGGGVLVPRDNQVIGRLNHGVRLVVVVPPSAPEVVEFRSDEVLSTNITLTWRVPANTGHPGIISYRITAVGGASPVVYNSPDNETAQTIPGLLPGVSYNLTVQAVSGYGSVTAVSDPSEPVMATTQFTVPAVMCESAVSTDGRINITWHYLHTGGLPLSSVNLTYTFQEGLNVIHGPVVVVESSALHYSVSELVTGPSYTFIVTASNARGQGSTSCPPVQHFIGVPREVSLLSVRPVSGSSVELILDTPSPGVASGQTIYYDVSYWSVPEAERGVTEFHVSVGTESIVSRIVGGLTTGTNYIFNVSVRNRYGVSRSVSSELVSLNGIANISAIVGGALGGIGVLLIALLVVIIIIVVVLTRMREGGSYHVTRKKSDSLYLSPKDLTVVSMSSGVRVEEVTNDFEMDFERRKELHYADLDTFRQPNEKSTPKTTSPPPEKRVEYATIDQFKTSAALPPVDPPTTNGHTIV